MKQLLMTPVELSSFYGVSLLLIQEALAKKNLLASNGKIQIRDFRNWCILNETPCSKTVTCTGCGKTLPSYYFTKSKRGALGRSCLSCQKKRREEKKENPQNPTLEGLFVSQGRANTYGVPCLESKRIETPKIPLSTFAEEYNLKKEEIIRLYVYTTRSEVSRFELSKKDILLNRKDAENFIISAFDFKRCSHCGKIKRYTEFNVDNNNQWQGCQCWCRGCTSDWRKKSAVERRLQKQADVELDALLQKYPSLKDKLKSA